MLKTTPKKYNPTEGNIVADNQNDKRNKNDSDKKGKNLIEEGK